MANARNRTGSGLALLQFSWWCVANAINEPGEIRSTQMALGLFGWMVVYYVLAVVPAWSLRIVRWCFYPYVAMLLWNLSHTYLDLPDLAYKRGQNALAALPHLLLWTLPFWRRRVVV